GVLRPVGPARVEGPAVMGRRRHGRPRSRDGRGALDGGAGRREDQRDRGLARDHGLAAPGRDRRDPRGAGGRRLPVGGGALVMSTVAETATGIRAFKVEVPDAALDDLRRRLGETRWPSRELVADRSQGVQLAALQELARYWATGHDWRRAES